MRRLWSDCRGNVAIGFGMLAPVVLLATAVAVDYSDGGRVKTNLQSTADAAALAGAVKLGSSRSEQAAKDTAETYVVTKTPEVARAIAVDGDKVIVDLSTDKKTHFSGILRQDTVRVAVKATAIYDVSPIPCMLALGENEPVGINLIGSAKINAPKCVVQSNAKGPESIRTQGAASLNARRVCATGGSDARSSPPATKCSSASDPYKNRTTDIVKSEPTRSIRTVVSSLLSTYTGPCDFSNMAVTTKDAVTLTPGVYCGGLSVQSVDVILAPGLYVMQDGPLSIQSHATVTGMGVSILLSGVNAVLDMQGSPSLTLVAMTTGSLAGIALASDTPAVPVLTSTLQGSPDVNLTGSVYLPNQRFEMQGSPALNLLGMNNTLIALSFRIQGSPDINIKSDSLNMKGTAVAGVRLLQ